MSKIKYLSHYLEEGQTTTFKKHGAFFAFSNEQFEEKREPNTAYASMPRGLFVPKENIQRFILDFNSVYAKAIQQDVADNGIDAIIWRELANYETQLVRDPSDAIDALKAYGIEPEKIQQEFSKYMAYCVEHDLF